MPSVSNGLSSKMQSGQTRYEYTAGDWRTALLAGAGFEFGKGNARLFTVSLNYFKGLGNLDDESMTTTNGTKTTTTTLSSKDSGMILPSNTGKIDFEKEGIVLACMNCNDMDDKNKPLLTADEALADGRRFFVFTIMLYPAPIATR